MTDHYFYSQPVINTMHRSTCVWTDRVWKGRTSHTASTSRQISNHLPSPLWRLQCLNPFKSIFYYYYYYYYLHQCTLHYQTCPSNAGTSL